MFSPSVFSPSVFSPSVFSAVGLQPRRGRAGVLERADPQHHRRLGDAGHGRRVRRRQLLEQQRQLLRPGQRPRRRVRHGQPVHGERHQGRHLLRRRHRHDADPTGRIDADRGPHADPHRLLEGRAQHDAPRRRHARQQARRRSGPGRRSAASSSTSRRCPRRCAEAAGRRRTPPARSRRTWSPRRSRASSTRTGREPRAPLRRHRRRRRRDPVLPLPRPEPARPGVGLRAAGPERLASEASLRHDFVLSQDAYGAGRRSRCARATSRCRPRRRPPRRDAAEIAGLIDAYTQAGGVVAPGSSLVTGYDFLADAAGRREDGARGRHGRGVRTRSITPANKSTAGPGVLDGRHSCATKLLRQPPRPDLPRRPLQRQQRPRRRLHDERAHDRARRVDGRTSPTRSSSAPAATPATTSSTATRSPASPSRSTGRRRSPGSGRRSSPAPATSTATPTSSSTASGSTALRAPAARRHGRGGGRRGARQGEARLPREHARHPRHPREGAARGDALRPADARRQHAGRPLRRRRRREARSTPVPVASGPGRDLGLRTFDLARGAEPDDQHAQLTNVLTNTQLTRNVALRPRRRRHEPRRARAAARRRQRDATDPSVVLRGVGFRGGDVHATPTIMPLTGAPTTELRGVHAPFVSPVFFPMRLVERQLLRRAQRVGRHQPARHPGAAPRRGRDARDEHAAQVLEPRPAPLLQRQPDQRRALRRADDRRHRRSARSRRCRLHRPGRRRPGRGIHSVWVTLHDAAARGRRSTCSSA